MEDKGESKFIILSAKDGLVKSIIGFLKDLLINNAINGVIIPNRVPNGSGIFPALITNPANLDTAEPLAPIMPVNASKAVMDFSRLSPSKKTIAVVLKPCESRALIELVKLKQAYLDNVVIIGIDCPGTFTTQRYKEKTQPLALSDKTSKTQKNDQNADSLFEIFHKLKPHHELRTACNVCENFSPGVADIIIGLYGLNINSEFLLGIHTPLGLATLEPLGLKFNDSGPKQLKSRQEAIGKLKDIRKKTASDLVKATERDIKGLDKFMNVLSNCINCHNCMTVCPICYCRECFFESPTFDLESSKYLQLAEHKGAMRLPANMFLFHVTRFNHMVLSCVACGMCEQGCPVDIPLLSIYKTVGQNAQKVFDYEPGRSLEEDIPILTFKEDELEPR